MQWHEFIFSEEQKPKLLRHLCFWASWWLYFFLCFLLLQNPSAGFHLTPGDYLPIKTFLLVLLFAGVWYPLMYYCFPQLTKGKWLKATIYFIVICTLLFFASIFLYWNIFPFTDSLFGSSKPLNKVTYFWPAINLGLINFIKVAAAATIIKYVKYWWLKQKESQRLEKEKINTELQLLKAQVHPDFLFKTLNNIYTHALTSSPRTSGMLLKLSDLLSYMLYECDRTTVPLGKEIAMMKEYMQLEKIRHDDAPEMEVNVKGDLNGKNIAPFLLLPFIENSFKYSSQMTEQSWINMDIRMNGDHFSMTLTNGLPEKVDGPSFNSNGLANVQKRLTLLYPGKYELKITSEQEMLIVFLNIQLDEMNVNSVEEEFNLEYASN